MLGLGVWRGALVAGALLLAWPAVPSAAEGIVLDVFDEYGVQIMTPAYEGDPEQPKVVPREQWYAPPASR